MPKMLHVVYENLFYEFIGNITVTKITEMDWWKENTISEMPQNYFLGNRWSFWLHKTNGIKFSVLKNSKCTTKQMKKK